MQKLTTKIKSLRTMVQTTAAIVAVFAISHIAYADENSLSIKGLLAKVYYHLINPIIMLAFAGAILYFMYGVVDFLRKRDSNATDAQDGKNHLLYGIIGLFIMTSAFAIARIMSSIVGPQEVKWTDVSGKTIYDTVHIETP